MSLRIGIVSAMEREVAPLMKTWAHETITHDGRSFSTWKSGSVTYIQSGIGRDPAIHATRGLLASERPDIIITAGFAGALIRILSVGDLITPGTVIDGQTGERFDFVCGTGVLVSSTSIADEAGKKKLAAKHAAEAVDMEGASVARVAAEHRIPCFAIKAISDELSFAMPPLNAYVKEDGTLALEQFAAHVVVRPGYWPGLMQLARNSKKASLELSGALQHLLSHSDNEQEIVQGMRELGVSARTAT
jgi:adenosylhomocysteine nucleosidase